VLSTATLRRLWLLGLILYLGLIAMASLLPPPDLPLNPGRYDKLWHAAAYLLAAVGCVPLFQRWRWLLLAGVGLAGYGLLMEWLQGFGGQRSYDLLDALANSAGVAVGLLGGISRWRGRLAAGSMSGRAR
jgi:VanZ family protein